MRPENTEPNRREKRSAALGLGLFALLQIACAVGFWALGQVPEMPRWLTILWWVLAGMCLVLLLPAAWALHIRIQEVDRGDAADMTKEESVMLLLNIEYVPGKEIEALGMVKGTVVQSKNFGKDFMAGMKTLVGGEITGYTEMLIEARQIAVKRMVDEAEALGADAITCRWTCTRKACRQQGLSIPHFMREENSMILRTRQAAGSTEWDPRWSMLCPPIWM